MEHETEASKAGTETRTLILGLGNELLRDDGVGLRAARRVAQLASDRADLAEACVATIDLLSLITGYDRVVVVDAWVSDDVPPGTPVRCAPDDLSPGFGRRSLHTLPFRDMLELGRQLGLPMPREVSIHGIAVEDVATLDTGLSTRVARAWPGWAERIYREEFGDGARRLPGVRATSPPRLREQQRTPVR